MSFEAYHRTVEEGQKKDRELQELKDQMKSMQEDIKNMFEVVRMAKQNNGMIGGGRTKMKIGISHFMMVQRERFAACQFQLIVLR
ncbi:MAG: hypothetical protein WBZ36_14625 [Candidatus Nitrosopolaris sp.]